MSESSWKARTDARLLTPAELTDWKKTGHYRILGVMGSTSPAWSPSGQGDRYLTALADAVDSELIRAQSMYGERLAVASGATNAGVLRIVYERCAERGITAIGIAPAAALRFALAPMSMMVPWGEAFGDESGFFLDVCDEFLLFAGGKQSESETRLAHALGRRVTVVRGFGGVADRFDPQELGGRHVRWVSADTGLSQVARGESGRPVAERPYDIAVLVPPDARPAFAAALAAWCRQSGLNVWPEVLAAAPGSVAQALAVSRAAAVCLPARRGVPARGGWGEVLREATAFPEFRLVTLAAPRGTSGDDDTDQALRQWSWVQLRRAKLTPSSITSFVEQLHAPDLARTSWDMWPVYLARGSRESEVRAARTVIAALHTLRARVVRDAALQDDEPWVVRARRVMRSCHGVVALLPDRDGATSRSVLIEALLALCEGMPLLLLVPESIDRRALDAEVDEAAAELRTSADEAVDLDAPVAELRARLAPHFRGPGAYRFANPNALAVQGLRRVLRAFRSGPLLDHPARPAWGFLGHSYRASAERYTLARRCVEATAGLPCRIGDDLRAGPASQAQIAELIAGAAFAICDVSGEVGEPALNTYIEAGMALGAGTPLHVLSTDREVPYMIAHADHATYTDDLELLAAARRIGMRYRRIAE